MFYLISIIFLLSLISLINNLSMKLQFASGGRLMIYLFGIIGVTIHEFSHYLFCIIFRHKVHEARFFAPNWQTGQLGYVKHSYNRNSLYQSIGQVFVSLAPMIVGTFIITFLYNLIGIESIGLKSMLNNPILLIKYITFVYIFICISSYMVCSVQDFANCISGIICISILLFICIFLFRGLFVMAIQGLILVLKLVLINLALSFLMFILVRR